MFKVPLSKGFPTIFCFISWISWLCFCNTMKITSWVAEWIERSSRSRGGHGFEPLLCQTKHVKRGTGCFLARCSALRGYNQDWLARCQDNVLCQDGWCTCVCSTVYHSLSLSLSLSLWTKQFLQLWKLTLPHHTSPYLTTPHHTSMVHAPCSPTRSQNQCRALFQILPRKRRIHQTFE